MNKYEYINTGRKVKLWELILSHDIEAEGVIRVIDPDGNTVAHVPWYEDKILELGDERGVASMTETSTVNFQILRGGQL